jgi:hypothetical protein
LYDELNTWLRSRPLRRMRRPQAYSRMAWYTPGYRLPGDKTSTAVLHFSIPRGASVPGWS